MKNSMKMIVVLTLLAVSSGAAAQAVSSEVALSMNQSLSQLEKIQANPELFVIRDFEKRSMNQDQLNACVATMKVLIDKFNNGLEITKSVGTKVSTLTSKTFLGQPTKEDGSDVTVQLETYGPSQQEFNDLVRKFPANWSGFSLARTGHGSPDEQDVAMGKVDVQIWEHLDQSGSKPEAFINCEGVGAN